MGPLFLPIVFSTFLIAGCGAGERADIPATTQPAAAPETRSTPTTLPPTTTTTAAPTTTTTLDSHAVLTTFIGHITNPGLTARGDVTIDLELGDLELTGEGEVEISGADSRLLVEFPGLPAEETVTVGHVQYQRTGDGPWTIDREAEDPFAQEPARPGASTTPIEDLQLVALLQTLGSLEHQGTLVESGDLIHRIALPRGEEPDPVAFGLDPATVGALDVSFRATSTGLPHEFRLRVEDLSDLNTPVTTTLTIQFVEFDIPVEILPPEEVWLTHTSDNGYSISHPRSWDIEVVPDTDGYGETRFYGLSGDELAVFANTIDPPGAVLLNAWLEGLRTSVQEDGGTLGPAEEYEIASLPARKISYTYDDEFGSVFAIYLVVQTNPDKVYEFILFGDDADREATERLLMDFLTTFTPS